MHGAKRVAQVVQKVRPAPRERGLPPDQHVVVTVFGGERKNFGGGSAEAPLGAIARDGRTDLARDRETDAGRSLVAARPGLQDEAFFGAFSRAGGGKKIAAFAQMVHVAARGRAPHCGVQRSLN